MAGDPVAGGTTEDGDPPQRSREPSAALATRERLPPGFVDRVGRLLPEREELAAFLDSLDRPRTRGLRCNVAKTSLDELAELLEISLEPVPWCPTGARLPEGVSLGGHPAHLAGLFYLQEPSSMSPVEALAAAPGWRVVDLAAAPGGKTTHLADVVGDTGLVVANEVVGGRLRSLHDNLDAWGARSVVTTSSDLRRLTETGLRDSMDGAVLDAPCSGEALFRRSPRLIREWSEQAVAGAARRQRQLLAEAARLVRPGGVLVYSTCTFGTVENEERVADFLATSPGWSLADYASAAPGVDPGVPLPPSPTEWTGRLWPHHGCGEGQFVARLVRDAGDPGDPGDVEDTAPTGTTSAASTASAASAASTARRHAPRHRSSTSGAGGGTGSVAGEAALRRAWQEFHGRVVPGFEAAQERLHVRGDRVFLLPEAGLPLATDALARPGLPLGRSRPGRFEPHPALATAVSVAEAARAIRWERDSPELAAFLRGETVASQGPDGWLLVQFERWGLGWAKRSHGVLKNMLPARARQRVVAREGRRGRGRAEQEP